MSKLCLHRGASIVNREDVFAAPTPEATATWQPIPHSRLITMLEDSLPNYGLSIVNEQHSLAKDDGRYFGIIEVAGTDGISHSDYTLTIGVRNSHDKSFPAGLCCGSRVFVCDNLAFSSEVTFGRRHTINIMRDLPQLMGKAMGRLLDARHTQDKRIAAYKQTEITDKEAAYIVLTMASNSVKAITKTQIQNVWNEYLNPRHNEFAERTAWSLFNAVTEISKGTNPFELSNRTMRLHGYIDSICGLQKQEDVIDAEYTVAT